MSRYIDADSLKKALRNWISEYWTEALTGDDAGVEFSDMIDREKTSDVEPVVHARWMMTCDTVKKCSNCGYDFMPTNSQHYCPCCGAKMDETVEESGRE